MRHLERRVRRLESILLPRPYKPTEEESRCEQASQELLSRMDDADAQEILEELRMIQTNRAQGQEVVWSKLFHGFWWIVKAHVRKGRPLEYPANVARMFRIYPGHEIHTLVCTSCNYCFPDNDVQYRCPLCGCTYPQIGDWLNWESL